MPTETSRLSGLPGPLVHELIAPQPAHDDRYHRQAEVYTEHSVRQAEAAVELLAAGIRFPLIRAALDDPATIAALERPTPPLRPPHTTSPWWKTPGYTRGVLTGSLAAMLIICAGTAIGILLGA